MKLLIVALRQNSDTFLTISHLDKFYQTGLLTERDEAEYLYKGKRHYFAQQNNMLISYTNMKIL